ncbi:MAG: hypothetical protein AAB654_21370 [Acidobacteriota bacterium]
MDAQALALICGIAGTLALVAGASLLIVDGLEQREGDSLRHWLVEIDLIDLLDRRKTIERTLYRHHRAFGATVIAGAAALLVALWTLHDHPPVTAWLTEMLGAWGVEAVMLVACASGLFALGIGVFLLIRPSILKKFEAEANRWIEPFPSRTQANARAETDVNRLIMRAPRVTGLLLLAAGLGCLLAYAG